MAGSKTILFIEDDHFIIDMYSRALKAAGYDVTEVNTGGEVVKIATEGNFDLILLDIWVPEKNGIQILQELRGDLDLIPNSKIAITTNYAQDESSKSALAAKADGYFIKAEITPKKMVTIAEQLIGPADSPPSSKNASKKSIDG